MNVFKNIPGNGKNAEITSISVLPAIFSTILMGECNTVLSDYTTYRHLGYYFTQPMILITVVAIN